MTYATSLGISCLRFEIATQRPGQRGGEEQQFHSHFLGLTTSLHVPSPGRGRKGILFAEESAPGTALRAFTWWSHLIPAVTPPTTPA